MKIFRLLALPLLLAPVTSLRAADEKATKPIPFSEIGAKATADYKGDAIGITATAEGRGCTRLSRSSPAPSPVKDCG